DLGLKLYGGAFLAVLVFSTLARSTQTKVNRKQRKAGSGQLVAALLLILLPIAAFIISILSDQQNDNPQATTTSGGDTDRDSLEALRIYLRSVEPDDKEALDAAAIKIEEARTSASASEIEVLDLLATRLQALQEGY